jgi:hypothetical protein
VGGGLIESLSLAQTVVAGTLLVSELDDAARSGAQSVPFLLTLQ